MSVRAYDFSMTIDGRPVAARTVRPVINPANERAFADAPDASKADVADAVSAARRAFPSWRATDLDVRRAAVARIGAVLRENVEDLARLLTCEQGRPLARAREEVLASAWWCEQIAQREIPTLVNEDSPTRLSRTYRAPIGVVAAVVPWNYPLILGVWKIAPALLTGNTVVVKPSPFTPLTMLRLGELVRPDLPPGVLNVISGGDEVGPWLTADPGVDKVSFTGSTATGRRVMASAAPRLKRLTLELGGNDAGIVMPDVDVASVAERLFWGAFANSGQLCVAIKRLYVHDDVYDAVAAALTAIAARVRVGDGLEPGVDLGPLQNQPQFLRVLDLLEDCRRARHRFLCGGGPSRQSGYFAPVTLVDNPPDDSRVVTEEAFGPVLPLLRFRDVDEVVERANAGPFGLAGSIWSRDLDRAAAVAARLETGTVWINEIDYTMPWTPFGGRKQSGLGVENGEEGLLQYTDPQTITLRRG